MTAKTEELETVHKSHWKTLRDLLPKYDFEPGRASTRVEDSVDTWVYTTAPVTYRYLEGNLQLELSSVKGKPYGLAVSRNIPAEQYTTLPETPIPHQISMILSDEDVRILGLLDEIARREVRTNEIREREFRRVPPFEVSIDYWFEKPHKKDYGAHQFMPNSSELTEGDKLVSMIFRDVNRLDSARFWELFAGFPLHGFNVQYESENGSYAMISDAPTELHGDPVLKMFSNYRDDKDKDFIAWTLAGISNHMMVYREILEGMKPLN
ncbi:MAG: hypothetical protein EPN86_06265 [Nanoarchaeota archaeon]|nr:MAG: hypothetical protein EPN86_06265 [Nanoarchaeota archaeon]